MLHRFLVFPVILIILIYPLFLVEVDSFLVDGLTCMDILLMKIQLERV